MTPSQAQALLARYIMTAARMAALEVDAAGQSVVERVKEVYMEPLGRGVPANPPPGPLGIRRGGLAKTIKAEPAKYFYAPGGGEIRKLFRAGGGGVLYARIHELGGMAGRGRRTAISARPYLRPAVLDRLEALREAARSGAKRAKVEVLGG